MNRYLHALSRFGLLLALCASVSSRAEESPSFTSIVIDDVKHELSAPSRWERDDWQDIGWASLAVVGTSVVADKPVRDYMLKQNQDNKFWLQVERFGREYAAGTIGAFLVAGTLGEDETSLRVAQDAISASLISSGIIGTTVKTVVGRSRPLTNKGTYHFAPFSDYNSSFFSGHSTQAFTLASVIAQHYEATWVDVTAYGLATLAATARTYHDKHFASDVVAGAIVGIWVGRSVVEHNRTLRSTRVAILPETAPGYVGVRLVSRF